MPAPVPTPINSVAAVFKDSPVAHALCTVSTSCQWATLHSIVTKINKKLRAEDRVDERQLATLLASRGEELNGAGVWVHWFGKGFYPIVITNLACARARRAQDTSDTYVCTCRSGETAEKAAGCFFRSTDYQAGRHALQTSGHLPNCACWTPPSTGHLHSWRKGYEQ